MNTLREKYDFIQIIKLAIWYMKTKILYSNARLIRFPFDIRGRRFINLGNNLTTGKNCRIEAYSVSGEKTIFFGDNVQINDNVHISSMKSVNIGNHVLMASNIYISDNSHGYYKHIDQGTDPYISPIERPYFISSVKIEDNVWIGEGVVIMPGVTIGKGSIIGANSVVTKCIPEFSIAVGAPARVIKKYNFENKVWELVLS